MSVAKRLYLLIFCSALGLLLVAGLGIYQTERVYTAANFGNVNTVPALEALDKITAGVAQTRLNIYRHVFLGTDAAKMAGSDRKLEEAENLVFKGLEEYEATIVDTEDRKRFENVSRLFKDYLAGTSGVLASSRANRKEEAKNLIPTLADKGFKLDEALAEYLDYNVELGKQSAAEAESIQTAAIMQAVVISVVTLLALMAFGMFILRALMKQLGGEPAYVSEIVSRVAAGDLTVQVETRANDTGSMLMGVKGMIVKLSEIITTVRTGADSLASASE